MFTVTELEEVFLNEDKYTIENIGGGIDHAIVEQVSKIARQGVVVLYDY